MALQLTREEYARLQDHVRKGARIGGRYATISEEKKQAIVDAWNEYPSITYTYKHAGVGFGTAKRILREYGMIA